MLCLIAVPSLCSPTGFNLAPIHSHANHNTVCTAEEPPNIIQTVLITAVEASKATNDNGIDTNGCFQGRVNIFEGGGKKAWT